MSETFDPKFKAAIGSLAPALEGDPVARRLFYSAGPVSDAFIESVGEMDLINGPVGSGKTTASIKRGLLSATRMRPDPATGIRRYVLGIWRHKYDALWKGTIPSWQRLLDPAKGIGNWVGSSPRAAEHTIRFRDAFGEVEMVARFMAFGEAMSADDLKSIEFTDCYLNEMDTLDEEAVETLIGRVGRDPPEALSKRPGRIFGDCNAPSINAWVYRDFFSQRKPGHQLFRQPGGREPGAENLGAVGRGYYDRLARLNAHKPWYVRAAVDNQPGFQRDADVVFDKFDDTRMVSAARIGFDPALPILAGIDGGLTMSAAYGQEMPDGQFRVLAEIAPERADERALADMMLALEARLFRGAEFYTVCDPAMEAGADTDIGSQRARLARHLGRSVHVARSNDVLSRHDAVKALIERTLSAGRPGLLLSGPDCSVLREGFNQGYVWHVMAGSKERSRVKDNRWTHVQDALQYIAMECGRAHARQLQRQLQQERRARRAKAAGGVRYNPLKR